MENFPSLSINLGEFYGEDLESLFPFISSLGTRYVELPLPLVLEEGLDRTRKLLEHFHFQVSAINSWTKVARESTSVKENLEMSIEVARVLQSSIVVIYFGEGDDDIGCFKANIIPYLSEKDIVFALENEFSGDATRAAEGCKRILGEVRSPGLRLNYDPANFYIAGEEPFPYGFELLGELISYMHLKDAKKVGRVEKGERGNFLEEESKRIWIGGKEEKVGYLAVPLGEGALNYEGLFHSLRERNYGGFISLEIHTERERQEETLRRSIEYVRRHLL